MHIRQLPDSPQDAAPDFLQGHQNYPLSEADPESPVLETHVRFPALDEHELSGVLYESRESAIPLLAAVLNCGGGIAANRYRHFARYVAAAGVPILTYDYRGVGFSRPPHLRGFPASAEDWSEFDCGGAIAWLRSTYPHTELLGIAHSVGTLLFGGAPNAYELKRFVFICAHTGYYGDYRPRYRLPMALLWHGVMPLLTRICGFFPAHVLGLGEDIPAGVAMQWASRMTPQLRPEATDRDGARGRALIARYSSLKGSVLVYSATDDAFATQAGTSRLLSYFPGLQAEYFVIAPSDVGLRKIGHFGFFRRRAQTTVWPKVMAAVKRVEASGRPRE